MQIRNVATVGGEVCSSFAQLDLPPALMALDAIIVAFGPNGRRAIKISEFFLDHFLTSLKKGELVTEVVVPTRGNLTGSAFEKFERNAVDLATLNVASLIALNSSGRCVEARIVIGGAGRTLTRATKAEKKLIGKQVDERIAEEAGKTASEEIRPVSSIEGSGWFKKELSRVLVRNTVRRASVIAEKN